MKYEVYYTAYRKSSGACITVNVPWSIRLDKMHHTDQDQQMLAYCVSHHSML